MLYNMFERAEKWCIHAGAGHFPDCDMLPIGAILQDYSPDNRTKFTPDEQITMMTLWSIMRSPLIIGGNMTKFDSFTMSLLTNPELIEMLNCSHSAHPLFRESREKGEQIAWFASHVDGQRYYLALFNCGEAPQQITARIPIPSQFHLLDIWDNTRSITDGSVITATVSPHGAKLFCLTRCGNDRVPIR